MRMIAMPFPAVLTALLLSSAAAGSAARRALAVPGDPPTTAAHAARTDDRPRTHAPSPGAQRPESTLDDRHGAPPSSGVPAPGSPQTEVERWPSVLARDPETAAALRRLRLYLPLIHEALAEHGIPADFAALPIIESALLPQATSRRGAAGMWQLMPATARGYGLEVSTWVDERRDPIRSTQAAARHLRDLHGELGSWHLAAAAYNCGAARLRAAIGSARTDRAYWRHRDRLPRETRVYVPKLLAAVRLAKESRGSHDELATVPDPTAVLRFAEVAVPGGTTLAAVAAEYGFTTDTLARLNPHLIRGTTPPRRTWPVRIPVR
jgi:membrane-bound lytic murein transglycosylase D